MRNAVRELKTRAEILHKKIKEGNKDALERLRRLAPYRAKKGEELLRMAQQIKRRDCLTLVAMECGFSSWPKAKSALSGVGVATEFGSLLCPERCAAHINQWFTRYEEAAQARAANHGYLLAHRREFVVALRPYIIALGLDPEDKDWAAMGYDWAHPRSVAARTRLYAKLLDVPARK